MVDFLPVLLGSDANVYGMARSFFEEYGVASAAICKRPLAATAHSRLVRVAVVEPRLEQDGAFVATLRRFALAHRGTALLLASCADGYTVLLARHRAALEPFYHFACPALQTVLNLGRKEAFYRACDAHGLAHPQTVVCTAAAHTGLRLPFGFPAIVKPANSAAYWNCSFPHKKKVFLARGRAELEAIADAIYASSYRDALIVQEYIPGDDSCMRVVNAYCGRDGRVQLLAVGQPLLEEQTPEGIGNYAAILTGPSLNDPALLGPLRDFLQAVGWRGFANLDVKRDPRTGVYHLFELNPRQGRSSYYATAAGCNLARFLVRDLLEGRQAAPCAVLLAETLWLIAPYGVLRRYLDDPALRAKAARLRRKGRCSHQLLCRRDAGARRLLWYWCNRLNYYRKMARYYGNKALRD